MSVPGSDLSRRRRRGFTLVEMLVVLLLLAVASAVVVLSLRDGDARRLEQEAARLGALLEMARAESRASGRPVVWLPQPANAGEPGFQFVGLGARTTLPTQWLGPGVQARVVGASALQLGPEAILPPQQVQLSLAEQQLVVASDGLAPFAVQDAPAAAR